MTANALRVSAATLALLITATAAILAAGRPNKPVTSMSTTMTFRCYSSPAPGDEAACSVSENSVQPNADHIGDDGSGSYAGSMGSVSAGTNIAGTGRAFLIFLHPDLSGSRAAECGASAVAGCNPDPLLPFDGTSALFDIAQVNVKVLNASTLEDGSLTAMACVADVAGQGSLALVQFTFWVTGGEGHWGLNFNKRAYHSTGATIRRVASKTWVVEAEASQYAELVSFGHSIIQGNKGPSHEGRYAVPFKLTIQGTSALPTGSTTCP